MKKQIKIEEVSTVSIEMLKVITNYDKAIKNFMSIINKCSTYLLEIPNVQIFTEDKIDYKNDGNTQTPGLGWSAYWIIPLTKIEEHLVSVHSFRNGYCKEALIFSFTNYDQRLSDGRISGCKFFDISFSFGDYKNIVDLSDETFVKNTHIKLDGINNNNSELSILSKKKNYLKVLMCLKKFEEVIKLEQILDNNIL